MYGPSKEEDHQRIKHKQNILNILNLPEIEAEMWGRWVEHFVRKGEDDKRVWSRNPVDSRPRRRPKKR